MYAAEAKPLNVVIFFMDDQRADTIAALGNSVIQTPNLDRLARRGLSFRRAYMQGGMNGATCVPSRAMLLSGQNLFHIDEKLMRDETWPAAFARAGYSTFATGKWHNGPTSIGKSFQAAHSIFSGGMTDPTKAKLSDLQGDKLTAPKAAPKHICEHFSDAAIDFIQQPKQGPFLCYIAYDGPHDPHIVPEDYPVKYAPESIPVPANFMEHYPFDNGEMTIRDEALLPWPRTKIAVQTMLAEYYRYVSYLDMQIGRVMDVIAKSPHADNTVIVFCADSGVARGSHGLIGKQNVYEHSMRVPLIIAGPGIVKDQQTDAMCYLFDLFPTLGKLCQVPAPAHSDGIEYTHVLKDPTSQARSQLLFAYKDVQRAIRDDRWKLIQYPKTNKTLLFDLKNDPNELNDLASQSDHRQDVQRMMKLLEGEQKVYGDDAPLRSANPKLAEWTPPRK